MGIDKQTIPSCLTIWIEKDSKLLKKFSDASNKSVGDEEPKQLWINEDMGSFNPDEYYFDESTNSIHYSVDLFIDGKCVNIYLDLPLSDVVLIDIIQYSIKKLNKLKLAIETLK